MIKSVEITNFRGIKSLKVDFNERVTVISGDNALGKSTILNAVNWVLTDSLFSDLGDIINSKEFASIKPIGMPARESVSVKLDIDGKTFTKIYKETYERNSLVVTGHKTEFKINDVAVKSSALFYKELYETLGYEPKVMVDGVREINLICDPLYGLLKLNPTKLRALLVALGCNIDNEEDFIKHASDFFKQNIGNMQGKTLLDKCTTFKTHLKGILNKTQHEIDLNESKKIDYSDVPDAFDENNINILKTEIEGYQRGIIQLENQGASDQVNTLKNELEKLEMEKKHYIASEEQKFKAEFDKYKLEFDNKISILKFQYDSDVIKHNTNRSVYADAVKNNELDVKAYELSIKEIKMAILKDETTVNTCITDASNLSIKLAAKLKEKYTGFVECQTCGCLTPIDPNAAAQFEKEKNAFIVDARAQLDALRKKEEEARKFLEEDTKELKEANKTYADAVQSLNTAKENLAKFDLENPGPQPSSDIASERAKYEEEYAKFKTRISYIPAVEYDTKINSIKAKIEALETDSKTAVDNEKRELVIKKLEAEAKLDAEYMKKSKCATKKQISEALQNAITKFNDVDFHLQEVNTIFQEIISTINEKAFKITGIRFVLLEENISNDGYSPVCYAVDERGVKFEHINTKEKTFFGAKFCNRVRELLFGDRCKLPYLMDKMEQLGDIESLKEIQAPQIICTKVSGDKELTFKYF